MKQDMGCCIRLGENKEQPSASDSTVGFGLELKTKEEK